MHENSVEAFMGEKFRLDRRCSEVLGAIMQLGSATDRMVKDFLNYEDMNTVRPRITELKKLGLVYEAGKAKCAKTGKRVRVVRVKPAEGFAPDEDMEQATLF